MEPDWLGLVGFEYPGPPRRPVSVLNGFRYDSLSGFQYGSFVRSLFPDFSAWVKITPNKPQHIMATDPQRIADLLPSEGRFSRKDMHFSPEVESTNTWLLSQQCIDGKFCIADHQTGGRGRRGRHWFDSRNSSILLSMGWQTRKTFVPGLSLVSGLAVVRALADENIVDVTLKWPNDVLASGRKLGGILVEAACGKIVIGIGINLCLDPSSGQSGIGQPWTDLNAMGYRCDRYRLINGLLGHHREMVAQCLENGFAGFCEDWNAVHAYRDRSVSVRRSGQVVTGIAKGVDENGALIVQTDLREWKIQTGEIALLETGESPAFAGQDDSGCRG